MGRGGGVGRRDVGWDGMWGDMCRGGRGICIGGWVGGWVGIKWVVGY